MQNNITHSFYANQLFNQYLSMTIDTNEKFTQMASTLLHSTQLISSSTTIKSTIQSFMELRSQYIGDINNIKIKNSNFNEHLVFNYHIFHAALFTNSPMIIDDIMVYLDFDFTTLNVQHHQIDLFKQTNAISNNSDEIYPNNWILRAITHATKNGHFESIKHLIEKYQLSPTIPIFDCHHYKTLHFVNLFYYATSSNNLQLIEYLLPLSFQSTNQKVLTESIFNLAEHGFLHLIQQFHIQYNIKFIQLQNLQGFTIIYAAIKSNNVDLVDYSIKITGIDPNIGQPLPLQYAIQHRKWNIVKHLIINHRVNTVVDNNLFRIALGDPDITTDMIDFIITTFRIPINDIVNTQVVAENPQTIQPLFIVAGQGNIVLFKHLIEKYHANPHVLLLNSNTSDGGTLLHCLLRNTKQLPSLPSLEMLEYLYKLGLDVNQVNQRQLSPIELSVNSRFKSNERPVYIIQWLIEHGAVIGDVYKLIYTAILNDQWSIIQYLIQTHQPQIHINQIQSPNDLPLIHAAVASRNQSIDFIRFLISLNTIDINGKDQHNKSPINYAIENINFSLDVVKLLFNNGAIITLNEWIILSKTMVNLASTDPYMAFECLDYIKSTFNFDLHQLYPSGHNNTLLLFSLHHLKFKYSSISRHKCNLNQIIVYRTFIHRYKVNINEQHNETNNTLLHYLAINNQFQLIPFTLLQSVQKPNIYLVNNKGETFLHLLALHFSKWFHDDQDGRRRQLELQHHVFETVDGIQSNHIPLQNPIQTDDRVTYLEDLLDYIVDLL